MNELDKIKSTITISMGTKNRLRKLKGSQSYEEFINYLIRLRNQVSHKVNNLIELQKFKRKKGIYSYENYKILFSYNRFNNSTNFIFDITIDLIRYKGVKISYNDFLRNISSKKNMDPLFVEYHTYFELLKTAIQNEIEPLFIHKGRIEDYFSWEQEFKMLNLSKRSYEEDVMEKLNEYSYKQGEF